jgi:hypothetical protein
MSLALELPSLFTNSPVPVSWDGEFLTVGKDQWAPVNKIAELSKCTVQAILGRIRRKELEACTVLGKIVVLVSDGE